LFGKRFVAFWAGIANPIDNFVATDSWLVRVVILCSLLSGLGAAFGVAVLVWRSSCYAFPLAVFPIVFPFLYYVTHTSLRYRLPVDPVVLLLTSIAVGALVRAVSQRAVAKAAD
jgi:ABC-type Fe3+-siderophore transport system permease subunit